ncbi:hypothetical protein PCC7418_2874 [Halothece sp. PCC 7418]|uniref:hypothetical protein n=1 Tax=Halothece sp. (strain PCC 7418) TaxID=65093 RepID=UPI0002A071C0|nr:hypothetical protein [Halothece sp. PCC 7418]AFZ45004.1 hypothetical protein PCC7418_2874 [Halothece sp. PCC 7418]
MNYKRIIFSGLVTALVGMGMGWVVGRAIPSPYTSEVYRDLGRKYAIVGGSFGLLMGLSQESLRQLKQQRDREENARHAKKHSSKESQNS